MNTALLALAVCGGIFFLVGRWKIIREARQIGLGWVLAIRCLPMADMMFLARYWEQGKAGAAYVLAGMILAAPFGVMRLYETRSRAHPVRHAQFAGDAIDQAALDRFEGASRLQRIETKEAKIEALNARMLQWYNSLQARRAALPANSPELITSFNDEAAAYQSLLSVKKEEAAELASLKTGEKP